MITASGSRGWQISEFKNRLVNRASSRKSRAIQRNLVLKQTNKNTMTKKIFICELWMIL